LPEIVQGFPFEFYGETYIAKVILLWTKRDDNQFEPVTTETGRNIVEGRVKEALGTAAAGTITPHSFRHYFVTIVLRASGNLKVAQALARHSNISTTSLYAHLADDELDKVYWETCREKPTLQAGPISPSIH
jgi:site-specific recombinase XerC